VRLSPAGSRARERSGHADRHKERLETSRHGCGRPAYPSWPVPDIAGRSALLLAAHRGAAWALSMRLIAIFFASPVPPPMADRPDDGLTTFVDGHPLDVHALLTLAAITSRAVG
jgi:hypothetical protein